MVHRQSQKLRAQVVLLERRLSLALHLLLARVGEEGIRANAATATGVDDTIGASFTPTTTVTLPCFNVA